MKHHQALLPAATAFVLAVTAVSTKPLPAQGATPRITRVAMANGSFNTAERPVTLGITVDGALPTAFRASENADMSNSVWRSMSSSPSFMLSSAAGRKIVYVQVGKSATTSTTTRVSQPVMTRLSGDFVPAPSIVSNIVGDTIVLGLPDIRSAVTMPAIVRDGGSFEVYVVISNAGQINPVTEPIEVYNSFVTNTISIDRVEVPFGVSRLTGKGCVITDTPTIECTLAPMGPGAATAIRLFASVRGGLQSGQTQATHSLRTRINGVRESNITNNWRDTPVTIVR